MDKTARILFICLSVALAAGVGYYWYAKNAEQAKPHLVILHANAKTAPAEAPQKFLPRWPKNITAHRDKADVGLRQHRRQE